MTRTVLFHVYTLYLHWSGRISDGVGRCAGHKNQLNGLWCQSSVGNRWFWPLVLVYIIGLDSYVRCGWVRWQDERVSVWASECACARDATWAVLDAKKSMQNMNVHGHDIIKCDFDFFGEYKMKSTVTIDILCFSSLSTRIHSTLMYGEADKRIRNEKNREERRRERKNGIRCRTGSIKCRRVKVKCQYLTKNCSTAKRNAGALRPLTQVQNLTQLYWRLCNVPMCMRLCHSINLNKTKPYTARPAVAQREENTADDETMCVWV